MIPDDGERGRNRFARRGAQRLCMPARETCGDVDAVTNDVERAQVRKHLLPHGQRECASRILPAERRHFIRANLEMPARWTRVLVEPRGKRVVRGGRKMLYDV